MLKRIVISHMKGLRLYVGLFFANVTAITALALIELHAQYFVFVTSLTLFVFLNARVLELVFRSGRKALVKIPPLGVTYAVALSFSTPYLAGSTFDFHILEHAYRIAQLFVGESSWTDRVIRDALTAGPVETTKLAMNLARIAAIIATVATILKLVRHFFDERKATAKGKVGHVILFGLGEAGLEFVRAWQRENGSNPDQQESSLLIVERKPQNPAIETARDLGFGVVVGDAFDPVVQRRAGVDSASAILLMLSDDKRNIELALEIREHLERHRNAFESKKGGGDHAFDGLTRILIHVDNSKLARRLQDHSRAGVETHTETRFFDFYETSARALFQDHPAAQTAETMGSNVVHIAIYGFGRMGDAVLRQALKVALSPAIDRTHVSIFDARANRREFVDSFWTTNSGLRRLIEGDRGYKPIELSLNFHSLPEASSGLAGELLKDCAEKAGDIPPTQHIICFDSDDLAAAFSLDLRDALRELKPCSDGTKYAWNAPIYVRLKRRHGLARLYLESNEPGNGSCDLCETPDNLFAFGMLDDLVKPRSLLDDERDDLARILHENGYHKVRDKHPPSESIWRKESQVPWSSLSIFLKNSNRAQADHIPVKLQALGCTISEPSFRVSTYDREKINTVWNSLLSAEGNSKNKELSSQRTEADQSPHPLYEIEHDRWSIFHYLEGWQHAEWRVNPARRHNNLQAWKELDAYSREFDAAHVLQIPDRLNELSTKTPRNQIETQLCVEVRVALIGHRTDRLKSSFPDLFSGSCENELRQDGHPLDSAFDKAIDGIRQSCQEVWPGFPIRITFVSPLAEGGDRLLTKTALKKFGSSAGLEVPLPLPWDVYFQTFDKDYRKQLVDEFKLIARHAQRIIELPSRFGTLAEIGVVDRKPKLNFEPHPHEKQYQLANAYIAQSCDFLFAIWDCREIEQCNFELNGSWLQPGRGRDEASSVPSYSAHAKPGGVWEALNWWMNSNQIPDSMRFELGSRPRRHQLRNQRDLTSVLLLK